MKLVLLSLQNEDKILSDLERILRSGGIVIVPTDTVYGLVGDATNEEVINNLFQIKQRSREKAFPIFVKDIPTARKYAYTSDAKAKFLKKIWPGPITAIFNHKEKLPKILTGGLDTIGIRIPRHYFLAKLLSRMNGPLVQTSANVSDQTPIKNAADIENMFWHLKYRVEYIVDGGTLETNPSAIIDFTGKNPMVLRSGVLSPKELETLLISFSSPR